MIPKGLRGVDRATDWGYSPTHGWIYGYKIHQLCFAGNQGVVFPFAVEVTPANFHDGDVFKKELMKRIPEKARYIVLDMMYDDMKIREECERRTKDGRREKRAIIMFRHKKKRKEGKRKEYEEWYKRKEIREIYELRGTTIERLHAHQSEVLQIKPLPVQGLKRVRVWILMEIFLYQICIIINSQQKSPRPCQIKDLLLAA